jgi:hypothetical protein
MARLPSWIPGAGFNKHVSKWQKNSKEMVDKIWDDGKALTVITSLLSDACSSTDVSNN